MKMPDKMCDPYNRSLFDQFCAKISGFADKKLLVQHLPMTLSSLCLALKYDFKNILFW